LCRDGGEQAAGKATGEGRAEECPAEASLGASAPVRTTALG